MERAISKVTTMEYSSIHLYIHSYPSIHLYEGSHVNCDWRGALYVNLGSKGTVCLLCWNRKPWQPHRWFGSRWPLSVNVLPQVFLGNRDIGHLLVEDVFLGPDAVVLDVLRPVELPHVKVECLKNEKNVHLVEDLEIHSQTVGGSIPSQNSYRIPSEESSSLY